MKQTMCILLLTFCCALFSCSPTHQISQYAELERILEAAPEGEYEHASHDVYDWYCTEGLFERSIDRITDVLKATYITTKQIDSKYVHIFDVIETLRGEGKDTRVYVHADAYEFGCHSDHEIKYSKGQDYLLLLTRNILPYTSYDYLRNIKDSVCIPLNDQGEADIENSSFCSGTLISNFKSEKFKTAVEEGRIIDEILNMTEDNPLSILPEGFVASENLDDIVNGSDCIFKIKPQYANESIYLYDNVCCEVTKVLKGDQNALTSRVDLLLPKDKVIYGEEYIVALNGDSNFSLSSRNSVYESSNEQKILKIIG